jgi:hypothetical protein
VPEEGVASTFRALLEVFRQHSLPLSLSRQVLKARILLKADASEAGEAWSDGQIAEALDTSIDTGARTRQKLVEEGLDVALTRKHSPNFARQRIFDGAAEAKLIAPMATIWDDGTTSSSDGSISGPEAARARAVPSTPNTALIPARFSTRTCPAIMDRSTRGSFRRR